MLTGPSTRTGGAVLVSLIPVPICLFVSDRQIMDPGNGHKCYTL